MEIITISGVANAIYGTVTGAKAYLAASSHGQAWLSLDSATQKQRLVTATRILERQSWLGAPTEPVDKSNLTNQPANTQPLQFPRTGLVDRNGVAVDSTSIPMDVDSASYEIALALGETTPTIQTSSTATSNVKRQKDLARVEGAITEDVEREFFRSTLDSQLGGPPRFPTIVQELIGLWLASGATVLSVPEFGGSDGCSFIEDQDLGFTGSGLP